MHVTNFISFVHLGDHPAPHVLPNMRRIRDQVKNSNIEVILSATNKQILEQAAHEGFLTHFYSGNEELNSIFSKHMDSHDHSFRKGFWRFSIERLFVFEQIYSIYNCNKILHLESDVMTAPNFPYAKIFELNHLTWCRFNESADVGALIYFPSSEKVKEFSRHLISALEINPGLTDMTALNRISQANTEINFFPVAENVQSRYLDDSNLSDITRTRVSELYPILGGIFDPAPLGMFVLGQDPRNNWGVIERKVKLPHSGIKEDEFQLLLTNEGLIKTNDNLNIFCLHAHSKDLRLFTRDNTKFLRKIFHKNNTGEKNREFSPRAFLSIYKDYQERGKLFSLFANLPISLKIREIKFVKRLENLLRSRS